MDDYGYEGEEWRPVAGFDWYDVSDFGRIRSWTGRGGLGNVLSPRLDKDGYCRVNLRRHGETVTKRVNRLVAEAFILCPDPSLQVNHIDGDKTYNAVENLEWMTSGENTRHAHQMGLMNPYPLAALGLGRQRVGVVLLETGEVFESIAECARHIGGDPSTIAKCLKGNGVNLSHRGFHFVLADEL